jgi:Papain family cysteine protease
VNTASQLINGGSTQDRRLDRVKMVDLRSLNFPISDALLVTEMKARSYTWSTTHVLDQGSEGACVGFGCSCELIARPAVEQGISNNFARLIYFEAQKKDPWPGGAYPGASPVYEGSSVLAGMQVLKEAGYIGEYRWAFDIHDLYLAVGYKGPAVIGVDWYEGMFSPDANGYIHPTGQIKGGHCVCIVGVKIVRDKFGVIDMLRSYFTIQNSWGTDWGMNGLCRITFVEMLILWPGGDFAIPLLRRKIK